MRIAIDLQGLQNKGHSIRGIGRYVKSLINALISSYPENEYFLIANGYLPDVKNIFLDYLDNKSFNIFYSKWYVPELKNSLIKEKYLHSLILEELHSYTFSRLNADLILCTSFFDGFEDDCTVTFNKEYDLPPILTIFYDLIPFIYQQDYLDTNIDFKEFYLSRVDRINELSGLLCISKASRSEACELLDFNQEFIFNISSACDSQIFNLDQHSNPFLFKHLPNKNTYILYTGAADPRKNLLTLIKAYCRLDVSLKDKYSLVLVGKFTENEREQINFEITKEREPKHRFIFLGYIADQELKYLYQNCSLFVFTSIHEGFGLPVLEAMSSGAVVLASNIPSIKEILCDDKYLFDPLDEKSISTKISIFLNDKNLRAEALRNSSHQIKNFSWRTTAEFLYHAFKRIIQETGSNSPCSIDWTTISKRRETNYRLFIRRIISYFDQFSGLLTDESYLEQLASCIDLNEKETDIYHRQFYPQESTNSWHIEGPFDSDYSLAILNRNFSLALSRVIENISMLNTEGTGNYNPNISFLKKKKDFYSLYLKTKSNKFNQISSRNLYPPRVRDMNSRVNMLHSYGWEETQFPSDWVDEFNTSLQGITVMSKKVQDILIDNGVYIPISICGLGVDHIENICPDKNYSIDTKSFVFLHISSCFPRKGVNLLLEAYGEAFTDDDDVSLVIKTFNNPHNNVRKYLTELRKRSDFPHVLLTEEDLDEYQLISLYKKSNCLVAPSFGEGFGLPLAEAMLLNIPVITTDWGGQKDFCDSSNSWLIDYTFCYAKTHFDLCFSLWAKPIHADLVKKLLQVFSATPEELQSKTRLAKNKIINNFTWEKVARQNLEFAKNSLLLPKSKTTNIGWVSSWNSRCGIASYSEHLINYIPDIISIFAPYIDDHLNAEEDYVHRTWRMNSPNENFSKLLNKIVSEGITTVVFQFNYGFYDLSQFSKLISQLKKLRINVILFLHSTQDPVGPVKKSLSSIKESLSCCDRLLVHTPADMNRLKAINLAENASLFPHGILDFTPEKSPNDFIVKNAWTHKKIWKLSSYGFCLPNKGFAELIRSIEYLRKKGIDIELDLYTAIYSRDYEWLYKDLKSLISTLDLDKIVNINSNYLSDLDILRALNKSDLIVFPYQSSNESSSAAVRHALSSCKPVAVTPLSIFEDVRAVTHQLPGTSVSSIGNGIIELLDNYKNILSNDSYIDKWRNQHYFSKLAPRLFGLIRALEQRNLINDN